MTDILEQQEENKPKKAVKSSLQKYEMEQEKKVGVNMYNPDNLTGDEQKIISSKSSRSQASFFISKCYVFSGWDASDLVLFDDVSYTQLNQSNSLALTSYLERSSFIYLRAAPNLQNL